MARRPRFARPRPMPGVQAQIARLEEELSLTAAFVATMERLGGHKAALGAIEEQRTRVADAERIMVRELARPRAHRIHATLAGVAAVLLLGSASFAGYRALVPGDGAQRTIIRSASVKLAEAATTENATQVAAIVDQVHRSLSALKPGTLAGTDRANVESILQQQLQILASKAPQASALAEKVQSLAKDLQVEVESPSPPPAPKPKPQRPKASAPPAPEPSAE